MVKRNLCKIPLIFAVFGLALAMFLTSCDNPANGGGGDDGGVLTSPATNGRLVISGLGDFDGHMIFVWGAYHEPYVQGVGLFAAHPLGFAGPIINPTVHGELIDGATVTLHLWEYDETGEHLLALSANRVQNLDNVHFDQVYIVTRNMSGADFEALEDYFADEGPRPDFWVSDGEVRITSAEGNVISGTFAAWEN